ncbi:MarR family transcriptional regulator [Mycobacterium sp. PS03-16]|uniref:MarR family winged helix-turn-helix transcriptional regulator n=1 Tax=Mycobacterium sp. PS03-16 TaxID=2559611 RepID=UPI001074049E|nr:MarR family transcriptional regulator [Mycobacterium sp. PS03-16]TFV55500.1 MarR family transcriptional regulator [Mycobacterium sp. PS03-16]
MTPAAEAVHQRDVDDIAAAVRTVVWSLRRFGEKQVGLEPLPHSEFEVVRTVSNHPGISVSDVARTLGLQASNVSTTVRRLVERGLLEREPDPLDRRATRLRLTPKAAQHKRSIDAVWDDAVRDQLGRMTDDEADLLVRAAPLFARLASMG